MSKADEEIGLQAAETVRKRTERMIENHGPTSLMNVIKRLGEALDAMEIKVFSGKNGIEYSEELVAHRIRLDAVKIALQLHDAMPSDKVEQTIRGDGDNPLWTIEIVEAGKPESRKKVKK